MRSSSESSASAGSAAGAGNFQIRRQTGTAGQGTAWRVCEGVRIEDGKDCGLLVFDKKKAADRPRQHKRKDAVAEILRRDIRYLERFRHPKLLQVWQPIEECSETITIATEPVWGSLANFFAASQQQQQQQERCGYSVPQEIRDGFTELEIKHGIYQITEALKFLHATQKVIHGNLSPTSIVITRRGCWKVSGLGFVEKSSLTRDAFNFTQWSPKVSKMAQPDLDFMAPDLQLSGKASQSCDMFSLGLLILAMHNGGVSLLESGRSLAQYQRRVDELPVNLPLALAQLPHELCDSVEKMLDREPRGRPSAQLFGMNKYFQDPLLLALEGLATCESKTLEQKKEFFNLLMQTMMREQFPKSILYKRIAPLIVENLHQSADLTPHVLPCYLRVIMHSTPEEFRTNLRDHTLGVLRKPKSAQTALVLLEHTDVLADRLTAEEVRSDLLPLVMASLESSSASAQEAALNAFYILQDHIDEQTMRKLILPRAKAVFGRSTSLNMQVRALVCLDQLIERLDKMTILEEILPFLLDITFSDPDIYMAVIHIYKHMLSDKRFGLTFGLIATKVLPHLIPYTVNPNLRRCDFRVVMETLNAMWLRLESGRFAQMKLEESNGSGSVDEGCVARPPLITMQQPSFDSELTTLLLVCGAGADDPMGEEDKFQHRRRSSSGLQQRREKLKKLTELVSGVRSSPDLSSVPPNKRVEAISRLLESSRTADISNAISRYRDSARRAASLTRQTSCDSVTTTAGIGISRRTSHSGCGSAGGGASCGGGSSPSRLLWETGQLSAASGQDSARRGITKTGSNPSFSLRATTATPRKGSATDICGNSVHEDANRSFTLSLPTAVLPRRHSVVANNNNSGSSAGESAQAPGASLSRPSSRRPSGQNPLVERLMEETSPARRSSFNALSDTVLNFFAGSGKANM